MCRFLNERTVFQKVDILFHFLTQCSFILMHSSLEGVAHGMMPCCKADAMFLCLTEACESTGCPQFKNKCHKGGKCKSKYLQPLLGNCRLPGMVGSGWFGARRHWGQVLSHAQSRDKDDISSWKTTVTRPWKYLLVQETIVSLAQLSACTSAIGTEVPVH